MTCRAVVLLAVSFSAGVCFAETPAPENIAFFEQKIRPVLAKSCYECHSEKAEKLKGELLLDSREGIRRGGASGPAVVPADLEKSLLIQAIRYEDEDLAMPPKKHGGKLPADVIADFEHWVRTGAADPREGKAKIVKKYDTEPAKKWWSYQPVVKPAIPEPKSATWPRSEIDRFVMAKLEEKGLEPVEDADAYSILRRLYFDLIGLPPSIAGIEEFQEEYAKNRQAAVAKVVDQLLDSPQYGVRWGRHWLDVARYAETSGRDVNAVYPEAWRYRDYVVSAFNADKPYDQFIIEQLAGDQLQDKTDEERAMNLIATGFLAVGPRSLNQANAKQFVLDVADEQIDSTSLAFLGLSVACARCHDHNFDPISQKDYTALAGIFLSTDTRYGTPGGVQARNTSYLIGMPKTIKLPMVDRKVDPAEWSKKAREYDFVRSLCLKELEAAKPVKELADGAMPMSEQDGLLDFKIVRLVDRMKQLEAEIIAFDAEGKLKPKLMGVLDKPATGGEKLPKEILNPLTGFENIGDSPFYGRGDINKPGEKIPRGLPQFLARNTDYKIKPGTSGRLEMAQWIASKDNALTARVMANRIWYWLYGQGIVASVDEFGTKGATPSNQPLLDYLAACFVENNWSVKKLIRQIVLSRSYQLSTKTHPKNFGLDPENAFVWRMNQRRLDAESLRDGMLAASGALDLAPQVGSLLARAGDGPVGGPRFAAATEATITKATGWFRSIYLPIARFNSPEVLTIFDFADPSVVSGARETTTVATQALFLMNSPVVEDIAICLAKHLDKNISGTADDRIKAACMLVFSRPPYPDELKALTDFVEAQPPQAGMQTWTRLCRALFASAEFRYLN